MVIKGCLADAHTHTEGLMNSLSSSWSKCGLLQVLRGERQAGEEQVEVKQGRFEEGKRNNNDGAAGV